VSAELVSCGFISAIKFSFNLPTAFHISHASLTSLGRVSEQSLAQKLDKPQAELLASIKCWLVSVFPRKKRSEVFCENLQRIQALREITAYW
jgi:hypothetical protein